MCYCLCWRLILLILSSQRVLIRHDDIIPCHYSKLMTVHRRSSTTYRLLSRVTLISVAFFSARCNIYISRLCYDVSVRLSVRLSETEVHWRIVPNAGFKFRSHFTTHCGRGAYGRARWKGSSPGRVEGSSRAMLATARPSCFTGNITAGLAWMCRHIRRLLKDLRV